MITISRSDPPEGPKGALIADCDLFSTVDGRVVDGDDPEANALIARRGLPIPPTAIEQFGITESGHAKEAKETRPEGTQAKEAGDEQKPGTHAASKK